MMIRDLTMNQKIKIDIISGIWKFKRNHGGDYEFERASKVGPLNDSKNYLILRNGATKIKLA